MPSREEIEHAAALLRAGRLVAFPTETVYGLGAHALDPEAVARIYAAKGRPASSPLIVHVAGVAAAQELVRTWPAAAKRLAARFWPGPLTLVLPKKDIVPDIVTAGRNTVGVRMPAHPVALALLTAARVPVAAPSANRFTELSPTTAQHVRDSLGDAVDCLLDGGPTDIGIESTVLSLAGPHPVLLRPGMVTQPEIELLIGPVAPVGIIDAAAHPAPGLHARHYSPRTPLLLVSATDPLPFGRGAYLGSGPRLRATHFEWMPADPVAYAATMYAVLHRLDHEHYDWLAVERPPDDPAWAGIRDRLQRAATG